MLGCSVAGLLVAGLLVCWVAGLLGCSEIIEREERENDKGRDGESDRGERKRGIYGDWYHIDKEAERERERERERTEKGREGQRENETKRGKER